MAEVRATWPLLGSGDVDRTPRVLKVIGCECDLTVFGHADLIRHLPLWDPKYLELVEHYHMTSASCECVNISRNVATLTAYGQGNVSLTITKDVTRPELSEFLLTKGWKMIMYSATREGGRMHFEEVWRNN